MKFVVYRAEIVEMQHQPTVNVPELGKFEMYSSTELAKARIYG